MKPCPLLEQLETATKTCFALTPPMIPPLFRLRSLLLPACLLATALAAEEKLPVVAIAPALQKLVERHNLIAGAVALVADKDKVLDLEAVGVSSLKTGTPMKTDDLFWIASMTKSITGTLFMMLVDEGKVSIDEPVEKYLPEFKGQQVAEEGAKTPPHPPKHPITIKEVLSHTSGLVLASERTLKHSYILKDDIADCASRPLRREPGTKFEYNNVGINTAARIIEVVSGQSYYDFLQKRLLDPLGMKDTGFWPDAAQAKRLAHSARFTADKTGLEEVELDKTATPALIAKLSQGVPVPPEMIGEMGIGKAAEYGHRYGEPAGGLFSTAPDLAKFCQMLLNGGTWQGKRYLSEQAVRQMSAIQTGDIIVNPQEGYGLGWFVKKGTAEGPAVGSFGHRGARRPIMWIDPANQLVMILLVERFDMTGEQQQELYSTFMKAAVQRYGKGR